MSGAFRGQAYHSRMPTGGALADRLRTLGSKHPNHQTILFLVFYVQTKGRTLPLETICLQSTSIVPGVDMSWSKELVREASITCVSLGASCLNSIEGSWNSGSPKAGS